MTQLRARIAVFAALIVVAASLVAAVPALAQTSAQQGYSTPGASSQQSVDPQGHSLPFTGLDVVAVVAGGVLLLSVGLGVRRLTRLAN